MRTRSGASMMIALTTLFVVTFITSMVFRLIRTESTLIEQHAWDLQTRWLLRSGSERAVLRFSSQPDFSGEVWEISGAELGTRYPGLVRITRSDQAPATFRITAEYPLINEQGVCTASRTLTITKNKDFQSPPPRND